MIVLGSAVSEANPSMIRAKFPSSSNVSPIVEGLRGSILSGRTTARQTIAIDKKYAAQDALIIDASSPWLLGRKGQGGHLRFTQPEEVAHWSGFLGA
jgi:hypothetical protein